MNVDELLWVTKGLELERKALAAIKKEACPTCAPEKNLSCKYRGTEECRLRAQLDELTARTGRLKRLEKGGVPKTFWGPLSRGELRDTQSLGFAKKLVQQAADPAGGRLMVLAGATGCGKSMAGGWAVMKTSGLWISAHDLCQPIPDPRMSDLLIVPLVVLDDVGQEWRSPKGYNASQLSRIACERMNRDLATLMTTNLTAKEWFGDDPRYDERLKSRLRGDPLGWHNVSDADMRGR